MYKPPKPVPLLMRNGRQTEPTHPRYLLEKCMITQLDALADLDRLHKLLGQRYIENQDATCRILCEQSTRTLAILHALLRDSEELRGIIAGKRETPKLKGFDYTRYDVHSY